MDKATAGIAGHVREMGGMCRLALALGACLAAPWALAQEASPAAGAGHAAAAAAEEQPLRLELNAATLPRFDPVDASNTTSRLDLTVLPPRRSAVGLAVWMTNLAAPNPQAASNFANQRPALDVGVHVRHTLDSNHQIDVTAWRRMTPQQPDAYTLIQQQQPRYLARVEMNLNAARKRGLAADKGFLGVQLDSGARLSLKRKHGGPMLYYRNSF
jgi:hypothetical protein